VRAAGLALRAVPRAALSLPPVWRRRAGVVLAAFIVLLSAYWFWFRDSSFARVQDVYVTGVAGPQARSIRLALENAGMDMTTLHVRPSALRDAVSDYPVVRSVTAQGQFPHKLTIEVALNLPVAILQSPTGRKPVAADGLLLPDVPITSGLPVLTTKVALPGERVTAGAPFELVRVVGLAPEPLRARLKSVSYRPGVGLVAQLRSGPELRFGDSTRLPAKWMAAARVLAAPAARGATYIDLRLPERPVAGGLSTTSVIPLAPAGAAPAPTPPTAPSASTTTATPTATATTPAPAPTTTGTAPTTTSQAPVTPTTGGATQAPQNSQPQVQSG
jgi:cell division protein FtsQ